MSGNLDGADITDVATPTRLPTERSFFLWGVFFVLTVLLGLSVGSADIEWSLLFSDRESPEAQLSQALFWKIRFPRVLTALSVGGGLALVGAVLQTSLRNPLADPFLLGVSSASAAGAVLAMAVGLSSMRFPAAVGCALVGLLVLDRISYRKGVFSDHNLLISGVALTYLFAAITGLIIALSDAQTTRNLLFWMMGGFHSLDTASTVLCSLVLIVSMAFLLTQSEDLDVLASGDESAHALGVRPDSLRRRLLIVCSVVVGVAVAASGGIGFVGVLVPHLARFFCGVCHRQVLWLCVLGGGGLTLLSDTVARTVLSPQEIPVGLITALIGAPFFLHLLHRGKGY